MMTDNLKVQARNTWSKESWKVLITSTFLEFLSRSNSLVETFPVLQLLHFAALREYFYIGKPKLPDTTVTQITNKQKAAETKSYLNKTINAP